MPSNRAPIRNVHFYNASTGEVLGGVYQQGSLTQATIIWILKNVLLIVEHDWHMKNRESGSTIEPTSSPLTAGDYDIYCSGDIKLTNEPWYARINSFSASGREDSFRDGIRLRDRSCVISGDKNYVYDYGWFYGFQAAHIFPLASESLWVQFNYQRWITNIPDTDTSSRINSVQNGFLIRQDLHTLFDQYLLSVNPDDGYKIITFFPNPFRVDGRILEYSCRNPDDPNHVSDELLRWHFRQSVLANMREAGEPLFETDFPPGTDQMATMRTEPYGKERLEMELAVRLPKPES
ncbi:hypothetical protein L228DRAFT_282514 [Xylona heveae TC161]|uniref:Uncharacterized protein n=1 Tax=Xylona heveae (strain CBS 132557 / TC161) TaxID=1328760 RepID=A0A165HQH1_XYLHT|nr:hypothetical protein L228DRAFT_282514 [Xylona heveae TC161]KZF23834.1 hypothetical protein L228DRAFT_282514 [Xylona heveae TC161]